MKEGVREERENHGASYCELRDEVASYRFALPNELVYTILSIINYTIQYRITTHILKSNQRVSR